MAQHPETLPPHYRRNFIAFVVDYVSFGVSLGFMNLSSVVPAFVRHLTASAPLVGLSSTIFLGGFQLPQLLWAHWTGHKPRKQPTMMLGTVGRLFLLVIAVALWAGLGRFPGAMLAVFFAAMAVFSGLDGLVTITWFDIMARTIPTQRRGRMIGLAQVISGVLGIGVGALVGLILSTYSRQPLLGYALLFTLAAACMVPSTIGLALIREPAAESTTAEADRGRQAGQFRTALRDPAFQRLLVCRLLLSGADMATPFFVLHAQDALQLPAGIIGAFVIAQTVGTILSSVVLGAVSERRGSRTVIRLASALAPLAPLIALAMHLSGSSWLVRGYPLAYAVVGAVFSAWMLGFANYTIEIAPQGLRPAYIGLSNTLAGVTVLMPTLGGWILQSSSYPVLFGLAFLIGAAGFIATLSLRAPLAAAQVGKQP
jgi:MFS family permease